MPVFSTEGPIDLAIDLQVGSLRITATDRSDVVVTVSPSTPSKAVDRRGAEETRVEMDGRRLSIIGPRPRITVFGPTESVDVEVELPTGSRLTAEIAAGSLRTTGTLGATRVKSGTGLVELDGTGDLWLRAGHGGATVVRADGDVEITADHGQIRVGAITRDAALKASHGSIQVGECGGSLDAKLSYGDLDVHSALGSVTAKTAYGSIRLDEVSAGSVELDSGYGTISVGVRRGIPAWLDLASKSGRVRNELAGHSAPAESEQTVAVRVRAQYGDVDVRRAS